MQFTYAIIGTGGLGGYYGGRLAEAGLDVNFLARGDYQALKDNGLEVKSCKGDFHLPQVSVFNDSTEMPKADIVLVCIKTNGNAALPRLIAPLLKPESLVVLVQNGLGIERELSIAMPGVDIAGATAFICSSRVAAASISHTAYGEITIAPLSGAIDERLLKVQQDFETAKIPCHLSDDIVTMRWKKLVWNVPYNGMSVTENAKTDHLTFDPECRARVIAIMDEVIVAGNASGATIDPSFAQKMIEMTESMAPYYPSMYLDHATGRPMEVGTMYEAPIAEAARHGFKMPLTMELCEELKKF